MSNQEFFVQMAAKKVIAKLADKGYTAEQIAEYITRPGHMEKIVLMAEDLHIQAFDFVIAQ